MRELLIRVATRTLLPDAAVGPVDIRASAAVPVVASADPVAR